MCAEFPVEPGDLIALSHGEGDALRLHDLNRLEVGARDRQVLGVVAVAVVALAENTSNL